MLFTRKFYILLVRLPLVSVNVNNTEATGGGSSSTTPPQWRQSVLAINTPDHTPRRAAVKVTWCGCNVPGSRPSDLISLPPCLLNLTARSLGRLSAPALRYPQTAAGTASLVSLPGCSHPPCHTNSHRSQCPLSCACALWRRVQTGQCGLSSSKERSQVK